jgi:hypothetical protein
MLHGVLTYKKYAVCPGLDYMIIKRPYGGNVYRIIMDTLIWIIGPEQERTMQEPE